MTRWFGRLLSAPWSGWRHKITPGGRWLVAAVFLAGLGTTVSVLIPFYQLFCSLAAVLAVVEVTGVLWRPRIRVAGGLPERSSVGETISGRFSLKNRSGRPAWDVTLRIASLPAGLRAGPAPRAVSELPTGDSAVQSLSIEPLRRGLYELPAAVVETTFPFNLVRTTVATHPLGSLLVVPDFHPLDAVRLPVAQRYQPGGIALTSQVGESAEYVGNREYVPGEPARRLDFRSWARLGRPVVREFQQEYYGRIALIVDTWIPLSGWREFGGGARDARLALRRFASGRWFPGSESTGVFAQFEAAISLAAAAADSLCGGEYIVDLFAAGPELYMFRSGRHTAHFENVLEILACVEACRDNPFTTLTPTIVDELSRLSAAVLVLLDWDEPRRELARAIVEEGCALKVVIVRDGPTTLDPLDEHLADVACYKPADVARGAVEVL